MNSRGLRVTKARSSSAVVQRSGSGVGAGDGRVGGGEAGRGRCEWPHLRQRRAENHVRERPRRNLLSVLFLQTGRVWAFTERERD